MTPDDAPALWWRDPRVRRAGRYLAIAAAAFASVIFFLFVTATANSAFFERNYTSLLWMNAAVVFALLVTVAILATRLVAHWRAGRFGAQLTIRLATLFVLMGVLPGTLIYAVSVQFLAKSLDSWFNVRVENALESGLNLGRAAIDAFKSDVSGKARSMALELADASASTQALTLVRLREQSQISDAALFTGNGRVVSWSGPGYALVPDVPSAAVLARARALRAFVVLEGEASGANANANPTANPGPSANSTAAASAGPLRIRAIVRVPRATGDLELSPEELYLQIIQPVPETIAMNAQSVETVRQDYRQLAFARKGLQRIYGVTLTMTLLLAAFAAMIVAVLLAQRLSRPLLELGEGTRAVAEGDYRPLPEKGVPDEIGALTRSFNRMTEQLSTTRAALLAREAELQRANSYLSNLLANISTGVLVFDPQYRLITANPAAERILGESLAVRAGDAIEALALPGAFASGIREHFAATATAGDAPWQAQFEAERSDAQLVLLARGSRLALAAGAGFVVVFDDISGVVSAQRAIAWGEVARRLAHEIKNPLTPIQLSAERLEIKLADKLPPEHAAMLRKSAQTIVAQVAAMKRMVDEFREYARMPSAELTALDLNRLIEEVVTLYGASPPRCELAAALPSIEGDASQLRQVIHNLLQNAQDAVAAAHPDADPDSLRETIVVRTKALEYSSVDADKRVAVRLEVQDRGSGFSPKIMARAFEPYVTTKPRGTGLGLAIVRKIVEEHGAKVELGNADVGGAIVGITFYRLAPSVAIAPAEVGAGTTHGKYSGRG